VTIRVSMLLKSRASLTCFRACFLLGLAKDLSAPGYYKCFAYGLPERLYRQNRQDQASGPTLGVNQPIH